MNLKPAALTSIFVVSMLVQATAQTLTVADVTQILQQGASAGVQLSPNSYIAVTDREGFVLGVYGVNMQPGDTGHDVRTVNAVDKAATAAYLSSAQNAFSTRTAGFIIQPHFPPNILNTPTGPLVGVGLSSLPFSDCNHFRNGSTPLVDARLVNTSLSGNPGGFPLYKNGVLVGGVGVDSAPNLTLTALNYVAGNSVDEQVAMIASAGYQPDSSIYGSDILINGIRFAYSNFFQSASAGTIPLNPAFLCPTFPISPSPGHAFNTETPSPFPGVPGTVRNPIVGSSYGPISGVPRLTAADVSTILLQGAVRSGQTRAAIRNPAGVASQNFIVVVDYYPTVSPPSIAPILGSFRTPDATIFSYDVACQKARTALYFSNNTVAFSARTVGFLSEQTYPPGIDGTAPGPYGPTNYGPVPFTNRLGLQVQASAEVVLKNGVPTAPFVTIPITPITPYLNNGITIFPGGFPLYKNGVLVGAVGVSGDGVDQDDLIAAAATVGFEAPTSIRADQYTYNGARLPYAKFPQNAAL